MLAFIGVLFCSAVASAAEPMSKAQCIAANEDGQDLRRDGKLREAEAHFSSCAVASCPAVLRDDCVTRLKEVEQALAPSDRDPIDESRDVATPEERPKKISMAPSAPGASPPVSGAPTAAYVALGVGAAGLVVGTVFTVLALVAQGRCSDTECDEGVDPERNDAEVRTNTTAAMIGYGTAAAGLGTGLWLYLSERRSSRTTASASRVTPIVGAGWVGFTGRF